jgi:predicted permease
MFNFPTLTRARARREVDEELHFHLTTVAAQLVSEGWSPPDAAAEARRRFGDLEYTRHYCRREDTLRAGERLRMTFIDELGADLRYAGRALRGAPGFTLVALLTLALGIGANTAVFSVVRAVLLSPLPFATPDRIVRVWHANHAAGFEKGAVSEPDFLDFRAQSRVAESMGAYLFANGMTGLDLTGDGNPERISVALVSDGFFQTLRVPTHLGRTLLPDDHQDGRNRAVVLSYAFWMRRFNGDDRILDRTISLNDVPFTVVGVMRPGFVYPADNALDAWVPLSFFPATAIGRVRGAHVLSMVARLKVGTTKEQLRADIATIATRNSTTYPDNPGWVDASVMPIRDSIVGDVRRPLVVLLGAVAMLLLITCVNIASLLLARSSARQSELAVRAALGAGRGRIIRQLMTESLVLSLAGGALGVLLAYAAVAGLMAGGVELPGVINVRIDGAMLTFTFVASVLSGVFFGFLPALRATSGSLEQTLRSDTRGSVGARGQRLRGGLVLAEVALAVMLVVGAGLATKSFTRLMSVKPGFDPSHALVAEVHIGPAHMGAGDEATSYYYAVLNAIRGVPGVKAAGSIRDLPLRGIGESFQPDAIGTTVPAGKGPTTQIHHISTDYFKAMAIPLISGRQFAMTDRPGTPSVVVVNEELVHRFWPGENGTGKQILVGTAPATIIGVVGNVHQNGIAEPVEPAVYVHVLRNLRVRMSIVVRTDGDPMQLANAVRRAIWSVDRSQTITGVTALDDVLAKSVGRQRVLAWMLALFGIIGLTLGALGIYGVLAFAVAQRRKEIGVRVALGATPQLVLRLIVGQGTQLATMGIVVGVVGARFLAQTMQSVLYDIQPTDLATFVQVVVVLFAAAALASWLPARRALKIDPVAALRAD